MSQKNIADAVATSLTNLAPAIREQVVSIMVTREKDKRADAIVTAMDKLNTLVNARRKVAKPDIQTFNADRTIASEVYSKERIEELKKADEAIEKGEKVINKALDGDMGDLYNWIK